MRCRPPYYSMFESSVTLPHVLMQAAYGSTAVVKWLWFYPAQLSFAQIVRAHAGTNILARSSDQYDKTSGFPLGP